MTKYKELKMHPLYWTLHKKFWQEEYDNLDKQSAAFVMKDPQGEEANILNRKVNTRIKEYLLTEA